jgi:hypothetical protein
MTSDNFLSLQRFKKNEVVITNKEGDETIDSDKYAEYDCGNLDQSKQMMMMKFTLVILATKFLTK